MPGSRRVLRRRVAFAALTVGVAWLHGCVTEHLADRMAELGAVAAMPPRIEVAYVRELELAPPPAVPTPMPVEPPAPPTPRAAPAAASAPRQVRKEAPPPPPPEPEPVAEAPPPPPEPKVATAPAPEPPPSEPASAAPVASAPATPASAPEPAASAADRFDWPSSTRLTYKLSGNVRGEVHGDAQVEWIRAGSRYQVHLDVTVGLPIAPLLSRRMSSDGTLGPDGLVPQRYDEDTKIAFRDRRRLTMLFLPDVVVLPDGRRHERWPGTQDTASQFVQLCWLFMSHPERLRTGASIEIPLALPRSVDRWVYDVQDEEMVYTSFGAVPAFHLKPRRVTRPGGDLVAEIWFAPQLRYLPARIRIQQDAETFIDLVLARKPELGS